MGDDTAKASTSTNRVATTKTIHTTTETGGNGGIADLSIEAPDSSTGGFTNATRRLKAQPALS